MTSGAQVQSNHDTARLSKSSEASHNDWAYGGRFLLIWVLPTAILIWSAFITWHYLIVAWPTLLTGMGGACLLNARRCARTHCYISGPFFLMLAIVGLLYGLGALPLGVNGWRVLSAALLIGGAILVYVPDRLFGHYGSAKSEQTCC
ncbi:MAG: hypothetical protein ACJ8R9_14490 [Steroidobacteraceae bacterium]